MSSKSMPGLSLRSIALPDEVRSFVWASRFRQARSDGMILFVVFAFVGFGIAGLGEALFFDDLSFAMSGPVALSCGLVAALWMAFLNFVDLPLVQRDLKAGVLVEANVVCSRAARVMLQGSSLTAVALDCGDAVLVFIGDWWLNKNKDIWEHPMKRKQFPGRRFRIQYLPLSGQVVRVQVDDGPLRIEESDDESDLVEPMISIHCSKYAEVVHVDQDFESLVAKETPT